MSINFFVIIIVVLVILIYLISRKPSMSDGDEFRGWKDFAEEHGLIYKAGTILEPVVITGNYCSHLVNIEIASGSLLETGGGYWFYTKINFDFAHQIAGRVSIKRKNVFSKGQFTTGDTVFDNKYSIDGWPEELVRQFVDSTDFSRRILKINPSLLRSSNKGLSLFLDRIENSNKDVNVIMSTICNIAKIVTNQK